MSGTEEQGAAKRREDTGAPVQVRLAGTEAVVQVADTVGLLAGSHRPLVQDCRIRAGAAVRPVEGTLTKCEAKKRYSRHP